MPTLAVARASNPSPTFPNKGGRPPGSKTGSGSPYYQALEKQARVQSGVRTSALSDPLFTLKETCLLLNLSQSSVRKLTRMGLLRSMRTTPVKGHLRYRLSWITAFMEANNNAGK